jgi:ammonia channel protein AmtB
MGVIALNWVRIVYSLNFAPGKWFVGCSDKLFLQGIAPATGQKNNYSKYNILIYLYKLFTLWFPDFQHSFQFHRNLYHHP